jgi:hypothetical protein
MAAGRRCLWVAAEYGRECRPGGARWTRTLVRLSAQHNPIAAAQSRSARRTAPEQTATPNP